jgi:hypothetical protein
MFAASSRLRRRIRYFSRSFGEPDWLTDFNNTSNMAGHTAFFYGKNTVTFHSCQFNFANLIRHFGITASCHSALFILTGSLDGL